MKFDGISGLIGSTYLSQVEINYNRTIKKFENLLLNKDLPLEGWKESEIEYALNTFAQMDANNRSGSCYVGEREGHVFSSLVKRRHFGLSHGVGRSGNLLEVQPKAPGSSALSLLTGSLVKNLVQRVCGIKAIHSTILLPLATGMSLNLCIRYLDSKKCCVRDHELQGPSRKTIIWSRIDQKSCVKSMQGFDIISIPQIVLSGKFGTNTKVVTELMETYAESLVCVITTTSCFAPRSPDDVVAVAELCKHKDVPHIVNNAYGLQCPSICDSLQKACKTGRVDYIVQSLDKNFMVPVGGSLVMTPNPEGLENLSSYYPGRATISHVVDLFITLLDLGISGYERVRNQRKRTFTQVLNTMPNMSNMTRNKISLSIPLIKHEYQNVDQIGSMLFHRGVSGAKLIKPINPAPHFPIPTAPYQVITDTSDLHNFGRHGLDINIDYYLVVAVSMMNDYGGFKKLQRLLESLKTGERMTLKTSDYTRDDESDDDGS